MLDHLQSQDVLSQVVVDLENAADHFDLRLLLLLGICCLGDLTWRGDRGSSCQFVLALMESCVQMLAVGPHKATS